MADFVVCHRQEKTGLDVRFAAGLIALFLMIPLPGFAETGEGGKLYREHCAVCHGDKGDGKTRARHGLNPPPRDFTSADAWERLTRERMLTSVTYGRPDTAMVPFGQRLSEKQIETVVEYVRSSFMRPPTVAQRHSGEHIYNKHCSACHGDKGAGATWTKHSLNPPPRNFTAAEARQGLSRERMLTSVTHGRPGTAMMAFQGRLSDSEISNVVSYIRQTFMKLEDSPDRAVSATTAAPPPAADMTLAFPHGLVGDEEAGRRFYRDNCASCHGPDGDGKGVRASFIQPPPRDFTSSESRRTLNRSALFRGISRGKRGTVMPAWGQVLDNQQIADVAEYVLQRFILAEKKTLNQQQ